VVTGAGIVGCGLIGGKRAAALGGVSLVAVHDVDPARRTALAARYPGCHVADTWQALVTRSDLNLVIIATSNDALTPVALGAIAAGKHVLIEKPAARNAVEFAPVVDEAKRMGVIVKVGFNHRFHPGLAKAHEIFASGALGPLMYIRGRYGHGGRIGYEREWRADPAVAGGGELLDQGVHLIDLARWFAGDYHQASGHIGTYFWPMPVEDNAFMQLTRQDGSVAWLHTSWSEWKNLFSFEVFGRDGKLQIDGLGGSYGVETLTWYRMLPEMGPPKIDSWEFPGPDRSWVKEFEDLQDAIANRRPPLGSGDDALAALKLIGQVYDRAGRSHAPAMRIGGSRE
jgi:predicted dehydrogenase